MPTLVWTWTNWPGKAAGASYVATIRFILSHLTGKAGKGGQAGGAGAGGRGQQQRGRRGNDVDVAVNLSFEDALEGAEVKIPVELELGCSQCYGSGAKAGTSPTICPECKGRGVKAESQGLFALSSPCPRCRGNGTVIESPCGGCHGTGREKRAVHCVRIQL